MNKTIITAKLERRRKFFLILPLLTIPFITLIFWAFGGGKAIGGVTKSGVQQGLNLKLPDAKLRDDNNLDKLSFYKQAALDSAKAKEARKLDPYRRRSVNDSVLSTNFDGAAPVTSMDTNEQKVYTKLNELKKALSKNERSPSYKEKPGYRTGFRQSGSSAQDVVKLQAMMQKMKEDKAEDPEITQLNEMLDKIQAIQHPEQVDKAAPATKKKKISVINKAPDHGVSLLEPQVKNDSNRNMDSTAGNAFYSSSLTSEKNNIDSQNTIEAVIPETQTFVTGATIKLSLKSEVMLDGLTLPAGIFVYGTASLSNERLKVEVASIRFNNLIIPVSLSVYDLDGQEGIYIPGSISRTVAKESANKGIGSISMPVISPSIEAQATGAGIEAAKSLLSKKVKLVKLTVKAGYKVFLKVANDH